MLPRRKSVWCAVFCACLFLGGPVSAQRWDGHEFAFCFVTDDGTTANEDWATVGLTLGFRFTIAVNVSSDVPGTGYLSHQQIHDLAMQGFEIAEHGSRHGFGGLGATCTVPPRGSLMGYFLCNDPPDLATRMASLRGEIDRDSIATYCNLPASSIRVLAYPRHLHGKALIDSLIAEGYIGARTGGRYDYLTNSCGDFNVQARNGWDTGISLYRVPVMRDDKGFFGDHSASPPVHYTYDQFLASAQPLITSMRAAGGIFVLFTHHLGDDAGVNHYGVGGVTAQDLSWIVDLVRSNNGVVMTFGDAVAYYRARTQMIGIGGDYVWMPDITAVGDPPSASLSDLRIQPNPFNPRTQVSFQLGARQRVRAAVYDLQGRLVAVLQEGESGPGRQDLTWDGRARDGRAVASGIYVLNVRAGGATLTGRLVLLR